MNVYIDPALPVIRLMFDRDENHMAERIESAFGDRPVRIVCGENGTPLQWAAMRARPDRWTAAEADHAGVSLDEANARGITIVQYGTMINPSDDAPLRSPIPPAIERNIEGGFFTHTYLDTFMPTGNNLVVVDEDLGFQEPVPMLECAPRLLVHLSSLALAATEIGDFREVDRPDKATYLLDVISATWEIAMELFDHDTDTYNPNAALPPINTEAVSTIVRERTHDGIRNLREAIDQSVDSMTNLERRLQETQQHLRGQQAQFDSLMRAAVDVSDEDVAREISAIQRHAQVDAFYVHERRRNNSNLVVLTTTIPMPHPHGEYPPIEMGPYELVFDFGLLRGVRISNLGNAIGGYDHPHVRGGSFCAGSWQTTVSELLSQGQLAAAVNFITACLEQVNADDAWGGSYRLWFEEA